jgi:hypothetical protein
VPLQVQCVDAEQQMGRVEAWNATAIKNVEDGAGRQSAAWNVRQMFACHQIVSAKVLSQCTLA